LLNRPQHQVTDDSPGVLHVSQKKGWGSPTRVGRFPDGSANLLP
jgi:hypothetical protein